MKFGTTMRVGFAVATLTMTTTAIAAAPQRTTSQGSFANFGFQKTRMATCLDGTEAPVFTNVQVTARQNVSKGAGQPVTATVVELLVSEFNSCDFGTFTSAFGSDEKPTYTQKNASSANVGASIAMFDSQNGMPLGTATVSMALTANATATKSTRDSRDVFGNITIVSRSRGSFADATAKGTILLGGVDLAAGATDSFAVLGDNVDSTTTFTRNTK